MPCPCPFKKQSRQAWYLVTIRVSTQLTRGRYKSMLGWDLYIFIGLTPHLLAVLNLSHMCAWITTALLRSHIKLHLLSRWVRDPKHSIFLFFQLGLCEILSNKYSYSWFELPLATRQSRWFNWYETALESQRSWVHITPTNMPVICFHRSWASTEYTTLTHIGVYGSKPKRIFSQRDGDGWWMNLPQAGSSCISLRARIEQQRFLTPTLEAVLDFSCSKKKKKLFIFYFSTSNSPSTNDRGWIDTK